LINFRKIDLKNAAEVFGLWDNVYGKDAIKALEHAQKWDPSRLGNKDKKVVQKKPLAVSVLIFDLKLSLWNVFKGIH